MSDLPIRTAVKGILEGITGIGPVHMHQRYMKRANDLGNLFTEGQKVRGWYMTRTGVSERILTDAVNEEILSWELRGYASLIDEDPSELSFADLVDEARDVIRANETLNGTIISHEVDGRVGLQVERIHPVMFCGVLCHEAQCSLQTKRHFVIEDPDEGYPHPAKVFIGISPELGLPNRDAYRDIETGEAPPPLEEV